MTTTAPYSARVATLLSGSMRHVSHVYAVGPDWPEPVALDIVSGTITWDEDRSPHVTASLQTRVPPAADLARLDPREAVRIDIFAGYAYGMREDVHLIASLNLMSHTRRAPSGDLLLTAGSDEYPLQRWSPLTESRIYGPQHGAGQVIAELIRWADPAATVHDQMTAVPWLAADETMVVDAADDLWPVIADITDRVGAWTYHDGIDTWHIIPQPVQPSSSAVLVRPGVLGTMKSLDAALDVSEWANVVVVTYRWRNASGSHEATGWAHVTSGPYAVSRVGRVSKHVIIDRPGSVSAAQVAARSMLARSITRGERVSVEAANAPYWLRPGMGISMQESTGLQTRLLAARVDIDIPSGAYHVTTRAPDIPVIETGAN